MLTARPSGVYYLMGVGLSNAINLHANQIRVIEVRPTDGSVQNLKLIENEPEKPYLAIVQRDVLSNAQSILGRAPKHLRVIATLHDELCHLIVRRSSGIDSLADLRGKRLEVGPPDSGSAFATNNVLKSLAIEVTQVNAADLQDAVARLRENAIDGIVFWRALPAPGVSEILRDPDLTLVHPNEATINQVTQNIADYTREAIPVGTYGQGDTLQTLGIRSFLVSSDSVSADTTLTALKLAYRFRTEIERNAPIAKTIPWGETKMLDEAAVPISQAARAFSAWLPSGTESESPWAQAIERSQRILEWIVGGLVAVATEKGIRWWNKRRSPANEENEAESAITSERP